MMVIGSAVHYKKSVASSFAWARDIFDHALDGTVLLADTIEYARGRGKRVWHCRPGQLLVTVILKPGVGKGVHLTALLMALSTGFVESFTKYGASLKWPNDAVIGGKKFGGMLLESVWNGERLAGCIVGFGSNINTEFLPGDPLFNRATSIYHTVGARVSQEKQLTAMLSSLDISYALWKQGHHEQLFMAWRDKLSLPTIPITLHRSDGRSLVGVARNVLSDGSLIIDSEGKETVIPYYETIDIFEQTTPI